jgi:hypothetical protein
MGLPNIAGASWALIGAIRWPRLRHTVAIMKHRTAPT